MLPCAGFGDDLFLAHFFGQQDFADAVIDFMRAGMVQVFALEVNLCAIRHQIGEIFRVVNRGWTTDVGFLQALHFIFKLVVLDDVVKRRFDFFHFCGQHRMVYRAAVGTEKALLVRAHHLG